MSKSGRYIQSSYRITIMRSFSSVVKNNSTRDEFNSNNFILTPPNTLVRSSFKLNSRLSFWDHFPVKKIPKKTVAMIKSVDFRLAREKPENPGKTLEAQLRDLI